MLVARMWSGINKAIRTGAEVTGRFKERTRDEGRGRLK